MPSQPFCWPPQLSIHCQVIGHDKEWQAQSYSQSSIKYFTSESESCRPDHTTWHINLDNNPYHPEKCCHPKLFIPKPPNSPPENPPPAKNPNPSLNLIIFPATNPLLAKSPPSEFDVLNYTHPETKQYIIGTMPYLTKKHAQLMYDHVAWLLKLLHENKITQWRKKNKPLQHMDSKYYKYPWLTNNCPAWMNKIFLISTKIKNTLWFILPQKTGMNIKSGIIAGTTIPKIKIWSSTLSIHPGQT